MIELIFQMLRADKHIGQSEVIDIARGKYKLPLTLSEKHKQKEIENGWLKAKR
jgi:hypothetical protein